MIGDFLTNSDITAPAKLSRPDYIGLVSGAQYKIEAAEGVSEYAIVVIGSGETHLYEMSTEDLRYLGRQITGLVDG